MLVQGFPQERSKLRHCLRTDDWPLLAELAGAEEEMERLVRIVTPD